MDSYRTHKKIEDIVKMFEERNKYKKSCYENAIIAAKCLNLKEKCKNEPSVSADALCENLKISMAERLLYDGTGLPEWAHILDPKQWP
jgi:hypothetical protein